MKSEPEISELGKKIGQGLDRAFEKMLEFKKQKKTPVVISRDGKVVEVAPEDFEKPER